MDQDSQSATPPNTRASSPISKGSYVFIAFAAILNLLTAWTMSRGQPLLSPYVFGRGFGSGLILLAVAYIARGTGNKRDLNAFARWYFWGSLIYLAVGRLYATSQL
jgi:hypothetical protein